MYKKIILALVFGGWSCGLMAEPVALQPQHPTNYTVKRGDTLWDIAGKFLTKPWRWPEIWRVNQQIANPHLIYPGDILTLTYVNGQPSLGLARGRTVKLTPESRETLHDGAIPPIPLNYIRPFLSRPRVVTPAEFQYAPYVFSSQDQHLISGAGNRIYVRGITDTTQTRYIIYRQGTIYRDHGQNAEILGYEALQVGDAVIERFGDPATAYVIQSSQEILNGDRLIPDSDTIYPRFVPRAPDSPVDGTIISVIEGVSQIGQYQVVVLNRGESNGLEPGHVLGIYQAGQWVRDKTQYVELPNEYIGYLMVFRTFERVSYGLIMHIDRPAHIYDSVGKP